MRLEFVTIDDVYAMLLIYIYIFVNVAPFSFSIK